MPKPKKEISNIELGFKINVALTPGSEVVIVTDKQKYYVVVDANASNEVCCSCECTFVQLRVPGEYVVDLRIDWHQYQLVDKNIFRLRKRFHCPPRFNGEVVREIHTKIT